jgi:hypothetical protein
MQGQWHGNTENTLTSRSRRPDRWQALNTLQFIGLVATIFRLSIRDLFQSFFIYLVGNRVGRFWLETKLPNPR